MDCISGGIQINRVLLYVQVLKPLPTLLLTFIGVCAAVVGGKGRLDLRLLIIAAAICIAAAGANGLTNYLDRRLDAGMSRTRERALASGTISPPEKAVPLILGCILAGLVLAWWLHPWVLAADAAGTLAAATWRKKITCVYPQGVIASCAPLMMGWFAVSPAFSLELVLFCLLIAVWLPLHVWTVMLSNREDYIKVGIKYFPLNAGNALPARLLLVFTLFLYASSIVLYFAGGFRLLYLAAANGLGIVMLVGSVKLLKSKSAGESWKLYKLSSFPYLGLLFLVIMIDILTR